MRETIFRAKRKDNGEWVDGFYVRLFEKENDLYKVKHYIFDGNTNLGEERYCGHGNYEKDVKFCKFEVIPETVGQYTGLTDKNGTKIFEGDIVKHHRTLWGADNSDVGAIQWCQKTCKFYRTSKFYAVQIVEIWEDTAQKYEVIGNIYDNPELSKGE